jgi:hypothetical protein
MTLAEIARLRAINQQFAGTKFKSAQTILEWFGAMQGQEYAQTKWGLGLRLQDLRDADIESNFTSGKILRTHLLRPTWHFVSSKDIRWLLTLTAPRVHQANAYMYRQLELDNRVFNKCHAILGNILQGGNQLTRNEINKEFHNQNIIAAGHRLSYIMMHAELEGLICSGARKRNQFTYALLEERVKHKRTLKPEEALRELTERYFKSRGPATIKDFATWSGLTVTDCKKGIGMITTSLEKVIVEKNEYYFYQSDSSNDNQVQNIHLLPIYDEFIMGYQDRDAFFQHKDITKKSLKLSYDNMVMMDGQIIGTWRRVVKSDSLIVSFQFLQSLSKSQSKLLERAVHHLAEFIGMPVAVKD